MSCSASPAAASPGNRAKIRRRDGPPGGAYARLHFAARGSSWRLGSEREDRDAEQVDRGRGIAGAGGVRAERRRGGAPGGGGQCVGEHDARRHHDLDPQRHRRNPHRRRRARRPARRASPLIRTPIPARISTSTAAQAPGQGRILSFSTHDAPAQVIAFYAQAVAAGGYTVANRMDMGSASTLTRAARRGQTVNIVATQAGGRHQGADHHRRRSRII